MRKHEGFTRVRKHSRMERFLPPDHATEQAIVQIGHRRTNNVQERANREIKRRTNVVQGFPSRESLIRLVGAALIEADGEWSARCVISRPSLAHAWRRPEAPAPSAESVLAARQAADRIISAAVDLGGEQG